MKAGKSLGMPKGVVRIHMPGGDSLWVRAYTLSFQNGLTVAANKVSLCERVAYDHHQSCHFGRSETEKYLILFLLPNQFLTYYPAISSALLKAMTQ